MAKMPYLIHRKNRFKIPNSVEQNFGLKRVVFSTILKQAISNFFRSNGLYMALFDNDTPFFF